MHRRILGPRINQMLGALFLADVIRRGEAMYPLSLNIDTFDLKTATHAEINEAMSIGRRLVIGVDPGVGKDKTAVVEHNPATGKVRVIS